MAALCASLLLTQTGCAGLTTPSDPEGTLETITGGTLRVGVTDSDRWVQLEPGQDPQGIEPGLVRDFAAAHDAEIEWFAGSEHQLAADLKHGELDMVIGGLAIDTPWITHAGMTRPYAQPTDKRGQKVKHVMLVPLGENGFLLELDRFLQGQQVAP